MVFFIFVHILIEQSVSKQWIPRSDATERIGFPLSHKRTLYEILVLFAYAHKPPLHAHTGAYNREEGLKLSLSLHLQPYCV